MSFKSAICAMIASTSIAESAVETYKNYASDYAYDNYNYASEYSYNAYAAYNKDYAYSYAYNKDSLYSYAYSKDYAY